MTCGMYLTRVIASLMNARALRYRSQSNQATEREAYNKKHKDRVRVNS